MNLTGNPDPERIELQPGVELWAAQMAALARSKMTGKITALVDVYEHAASTYLAVDMIGSETGDMSVTLLAGCRATDYNFNDLKATCFDVVDLAQARWMVDQLLDALGVDLTR